MFRCWAIVAMGFCSLCSSVRGDEIRVLVFDGVGNRLCDDGETGRAGSVTLRPLAKSSLGRQAATTSRLNCPGGARFDVAPGVAYSLETQVPGFRPRRNLIRADSGNREIRVAVELGLRSPTDDLPVVGRIVGDNISASWVQLVPAFDHPPVGLPWIQNAAVASDGSFIYPPLESSVSTLLVFGAPEKAGEKPILLHAELFRADAPPKEIHIEPRRD